jgi:hypothetical protein
MAFLAVKLLGPVAVAGVALKVVVDATVAVRAVEWEFLAQAQTAQQG